MGLRTVGSDGVRLNVVDEGEGPAVLLLHGFPDSSALWRHQIPALVEAGYRAIAPDQRGFGESDKPQDVAGYRIDRLLSDALAVLDACGVERAQVVGHDWGAVVSWLLTMLHPMRVERLVAVSVGKPGMRRRTARELRNFWYMFVFQFEGAAEEALMRNDWQLFREWVADTAPDLDRYIAALSRPGALTAGLNWYRANARPEMLLAEPGPTPTVTVPVLGVWSTRDLALSEEQMVDSAAGVSGPWRYERFEGIGHWIPVEAHERFTSLLLEFLAS